jgi:hypothetical protein
MKALLVLGKCEKMIVDGIDELGPSVERRDPRAGLRTGIDLRIDQALFGEKPPDLESKVSGRLDVAAAKGKRKITGIENPVDRHDEIPEFLVVWVVGEWKALLKFGNYVEIKKLCTFWKDNWGGRMYCVDCLERAQEVGGGVRI